jgi:hypothetical protein
MPDRRRQCTLSSRGASAGRCAHDEEVRGDPVVRDRQGRSCSMLGQPSSACITWSGNPRRSRASPSGPCGLSIRPSLVREKSGKTSMPSAARLREASTYSRPDFAARRRRWPSRPTRGTASSAWRTAGREAGARVRADAGQGRQRISPCCHADAGSWAPIRSGHCSSTWRGRRARTGHRGMSCCGLRVIPWTGPRQTYRTARRTPGSGRPANQSRNEAFGRPGGRRRQSPGPAAGADISSGGSRHAGAPTSRTAKR